MHAEEIANKVQELVDIEDIKKLHIGYVYALNSLQWDEMLDCFTEKRSNRPLESRVVPWENGN